MKDVVVRSVVGQIQVAPEVTPVLVGGGVLQGRVSQWPIFPLKIDRDSALGRLILLFRREGQHVEEELRLCHVLAVPLHDERAHHDVPQSSHPTRGESCRLRLVLDIRFRAPLGTLLNQPLMTRREEISAQALLSPCSPGQDRDEHWP